jgi:hypothetical protein
MQATVCAVRQREKPCSMQHDALKVNL